MAQYKPDHFNTVSVYLIVKDGKAALDFYQRAFGGEGGACLLGPDDSVMHAEVCIGNSTIMLSEENEAWGMKSCETMGGSPASMMIYVEDCDAAFKQAIDAGCTEVSAPADQFWGDRHGKVKDPFGYEWGIATQIEQLSVEEIQKRGQEWMQQMAQQQQ